MTAATVIPFNFQPVSSPVIKTSAYSVPLGQYAYVQPRCGNFTLNTVLLGQSFAVTLSAANAGNSSTNFFVAGPAYYTYSLSQNLSGGTGTYIIYNAGYFTAATGNIQVAGGAATYSNLTGTFWGTGIQATRTGTTGNWAGGSGTVYVLSCPEGFWAYPGDALDGASYLVTLYNQIT